MADTLLQETLRSMKSAGKGIKDVAWVGTSDFHTDWATFAKEVMEYEYHDGYGSAEVERDLKVVFTDGSWLERAEYDGSEWWSYKSTPVKPDKTKAELLAGATEDHWWHSEGDAAFVWGYNRKVHISRWS